jgi:hypothetical protein
MLDVIVGSRDRAMVREARLPRAGIMEHWIWFLGHNASRCSLRGLEHLSTQGMF